MDIVHKIRAQSKEKPTHIICTTNIISQLSHIIYTGQRCSVFNSAAIMKIQMGEISKLG
jgi:hypothetical protein